MSQLPLSVGQKVRVQVELDDGVELDPGNRTYVLRVPDGKVQLKIKRAVTEAGARAVGPARMREALKEALHELYDAEASKVIDARLAEFYDINKRLEEYAEEHGKTDGCLNEQEEARRKELAADVQDWSELAFQEVPAYAKLQARSEYWWGIFQRETVKHTLVAIENPPDPAAANGKPAAPVEVKLKRSRGVLDEAELGKLGDDLAAIALRGMALFNVEDAEKNA